MLSNLQVPHNNDGEGTILIDSAPNGLPIAVNQKAYYSAKEEIDSLILDLKEYANLMSPRQRDSLRELSGLGTSEIMNIDEVQKQYQVILKIREQIMDKDGQLLAGVPVKDITSFTVATSSLIKLFLHAQDKIDHLREVALIREAVIQAVGVLPQDVRTKFFESYDAVVSSRR